MSKTIFFALAIACGITTSIQSGVNSELRKSIEHPVFAAIISFSTGLLSLLLFFIFFNKKPLPSLETLGGLSWWQLTGGLLGAFFVTTVILSVKEIGSANMTALIVAGQVLGAIVIDHYGWLGFLQHPLSIFRFFGAVLIVGGVYLVVKN